MDELGFEEILTTDFTTSTDKKNREYLEEFLSRPFA
jgi:hypothetical protein